VMLPPAGTIGDLVTSDPDLASLSFAVNAAGLLADLSGPGPFTLLAPTNAAFNALNPADLARILGDAATLQEVLRYHVVPAATLCSAGLESGPATMLSGDDVIVEVDGVAGIITVDDAQVVGADLSVSNGVVHAIDRVLLPERLFPSGSITIMARK